MNALAPTLLYPNEAEDREAEAITEALETAHLYRVAFEAFRAGIAAIPRTRHTICPMGCIDDVLGSLEDFAPYDDGEVERLAEERFWDRENSV